MPMHLRIAHDASASTTSHPTRTVHCFVALSADIAVSLNALHPYAPLVILRLLHSASPAPTTAIHVAWVGDTTPAPQTLSLHPVFAHTLSLPANDVVAASVAERIHTASAARYPLRAATLRPVAYDGVASGGEGECRGGKASGEDLSQQTAVAQFDAVSAAADTLQRTVLTAVRVLSLGMVVPLSLPAGTIVNVRVVALDVPVDADPPYAVLNPDTELHIEPPPTTSSTRPSHRLKGEGGNVRHFLRVAALEVELFQNIPRVSLLSQAFVPVAFAGEGEGVKEDQDDFCVVVSVKMPIHSSDVVPAVTVRAQGHKAVPSGCIALPPAVWHRLQLTPLMPVLVEKVANPSFASEVAVALTRKSHDGVTQRVSNAFATMEDVISSSGIVFHSMRVNGGVVLTATRETADDVPLLPVARPDPWVDAKLAGLENGGGGEGEEKEGGDDDIQRAEIAALEKQLPPYSLKQQIERAAAKRRLLPSVRVSTNTVVKEQDASSRIGAHIAKHDLPTDADSYPQREHDVRKGLLSCLTPSVQDAVSSLLKDLSELHRPSTQGSDGHGVNVVAMEGPAGSGRTHAATTVAAVLRDVSQMRTAWLRGRAHADETASSRVRRLEVAFDAAVDGGDGLVVLDDFEIFAGGMAALETNEDVGQERGNEAGREENVRVVSTSLERLVNKRWPFIVTLLLVCENVDDLPVSVRAPGFIDVVVNMHAAKVEDRAFMILRQLEDVSLPEQSSGDRQNVAERAVSLAKMADGYSLRDMQVMMRCARLSLEETECAEGSKSATTLGNAIEVTIDTMLPLSGIGPDTSEDKTSERLSWDDIGGCDSVKASLRDALELPSLHASIFRNVPMRLPRGILLYGPPGCGKTLLAKTAAHESGLRTIVIKGPELMGKYVGQSEGGVRRAFERASANAPCMLLFDEFDALAPSRGGWDAGVTDRVVNTLLACLDGVERMADGVFVVATSSRPEVIDAAVLRPGRLDRWVEVGVPKDARERGEILTCVARGVLPFWEAEGVRSALREIAEGTEGYTGADLGAVVNDALLALEEEDEDEEVGSGRGGQDGEALEKGEVVEERVVRALMQAKANSRVSLSVEQRKHYELVMAKFSASGRGGKEKETALKKLSQQFGKKLALQ